MTHRLRLPCGSVALIDEQDLGKLAGWSWFRTKRSDGAPSYVIGAQGRRRVALSRLIMGEPVGRLVDHANGDLLDNRRSNLRVCSASENNRNRDRGKNNTTGCKGVSLDRTGKRYRATICVDGRLLSLGCFNTVAEAGRAYDRAALAHFGEFARLNFPPSRDWLFPLEVTGKWPPAPPVRTRQLGRGMGEGENP